VSPDKAAIPGGGVENHPVGIQKKGTVVRRSFSPRSKDSSPEGSPQRFSRVVAEREDEAMSKSGIYKQ
jgi:hypothetical protein